jgi:hypothetical protein
MVRGAAVPPRTIFTKDVSKVTRPPTNARGKMQIFLGNGFAEHNTLIINDFYTVTIS